MLNVIVCPVAGVVKMDLLKSEDFAHDLRCAYLAARYWTSMDPERAQYALDNVTIGDLEIQTHDIVLFLEQSAEFDDRHFDRCDIEGDRIDRTKPYHDLLRTMREVHGYNSWQAQIVSSVNTVLWSYVSDRDDEWILRGSIYAWLESEDSRSDREWMLERYKEMLRFRIRNNVFT